jgi:hypothetical protein
MNVGSASGSISLSNPVAGTQISSPVSVQGNYLASGSNLGRIVLYDNTYVTVSNTGDLHSSLTSGMGPLAMQLPSKLWGSSGGRSCFLLDQSE